jgi:hypothetical protein
MSRRRRFERLGAAIRLKCSRKRSPRAQYRPSRHAGIHLCDQRRQGNPGVSGIHPGASEPIIAHERRSHEEKSNIACVLSLRRHAMQRAGFGRGCRSRPNTGTALVHELSCGCSQPAPGNHRGASFCDDRGQTGLRCEPLGEFSAQSASQDAEHVADTSRDSRPCRLHRLIAKIERA